jgi:hypothetical protein
VRDDERQRQKDVSDRQEENIILFEESDNFASKSDPLQIPEEWR